MISDYEQLECLHINENNERQSLGFGPFWRNKWYRLFINMQIRVQICQSIDNNIVHLNLNNMGMQNYTFMFYPSFKRKMKIKLIYHL